MEPIIEKPRTPQVVMIPQADLIVPPWNPRKIMDEGEILDLMAYMEKGGLLPRILVWKGGGEAPWNVISGQRRLEGHRRLNREAVEAEILDISLEEAKRLAITSNQGLDLYWLDKYESWEPYFKDPRFESQEAIGSYLGVDSTWISRANNLMKVLNPSARQMIRQSLRESAVNGDAKNKGNIDVHETLMNTPKTLKNRTPKKTKKWQLVEEVAFRITALWDKRSLQDAQALAHQALGVMIARKLSGPQTDELINHLTSGGDPVQFEPSAKGKRQPKANSKPEIPTSLTAPTGSTSSPQVGAVTMDGSHSQTQPAKTPTSTHTPVTLPAMGKTLGQGILWGWVKKLGVKEVELINRSLIRRTVGYVFNGAIALLVIGGGAAYVSRNHHWGWISPKTESPKIAVTTGSSGTTEAQLNASNNKGLVVQKPKTIIKAQTEPEATSPKAGDQAKLIAWAEADAPFVSQFVDRFYGLSYSGYQDNFDYFKQQVADGYLTEFMSGYFPAEKIRDIQEKKLAFFFQPSQPPRLVNLDGVMDEFKVTGTLTTVSHSGKTPQTLSSQPVALKVNLRHIAGAKGLVYRVTTMDPQETELTETASVSSASESAGTKKGEDPFKAIGDGVKDASHAVNTADQAANIAKKLIGF